MALCKFTFIEAVETFIQQVVVYTSLLKIASYISCLSNQGEALQKKLNLSAI